jgi:hypothetical protein
VELSPAFLNTRYAAYRQQYSTITQAGYGSGYEGIWSVRIVHAIGHAENLGFNVVGVLPGQVLKNFLKICEWLDLPISAFRRNRTLFRKLWLAYDALRLQSEEVGLSTKETTLMERCHSLLHGDLLPRVQEHTSSSIIANLSLKDITDKILTPIVSSVDVFLFVKT